MTRGSLLKDSGASQVALRLRRARRRIARGQRRVRGHGVTRASLSVPTRESVLSRGTGRFEGKTRSINLHLPEAMLEVIDSYVFACKRHDRGVSRTSFVRAALEPVVERLVEEGYGEEKG